MKEKKWPDGAHQAIEILRHAGSEASGAVPGQAAMLGFRTGFWCSKEAEKAPLGERASPRQVGPWVDGLLPYFLSFLPRFERDMVLRVARVGRGDRVVDGRLDLETEGRGVGATRVRVGVDEFERIELVLRVFTLGVLVVGRLIFGAVTEGRGVGATRIRVGVDEFERIEPVLRVFTLGVPVVGRLIFGAVTVGRGFDTAGLVNFGAVRVTVGLGTFRVLVGFAAGDLAVVDRSVGLATVALFDVPEEGVFVARLRNWLNPDVADGDAVRLGLIVLAVFDVLVLSDRLVLPAGPASADEVVRKLSSRLGRLVVCEDACDLGFAFDVGPAFDVAS